jgi:filamentous hemagglutinin family protein
MKYYSKKQWTHKLTVMVLLAMALGGTAVQAMPSGGDIRSGQGSISQDGKNMTVLQNSDRMAIDWTKFDIAKDETVRYAQPDRNAISLNRVTGGQQSVIAGNLNANGNVVLVNPNGVVFTKNSSVDVGGLVASTARLNDEAMKNFGNGKDSLGLSLDKDSTAAVINEGQIKAQGGLVALHAANVENKGTITNEGGTLAMAAAKNLTLSAADDDKLNFTVDGDLAKAQALNSGSLKADGGYVVMTVKSAGDVLSTVVNNSGTIEAKTLRKNEKGQILLDGGDNGQVEVSGTLDASGIEAGQDAGNIKVIGQKTVVHDNTNLLAKGDNNGGKIETSGDVLNLGDNLNIDAKGVNGKAGEWLLDPLDVIIADSDPTVNYDSSTMGILRYDGTTSSITKDTTIAYHDPTADTAEAASTNTAVTWINSETINTLLNQGTNVTIQAAATNGVANITVNSAISKTAGGDANFTLEAMRNITINKDITSSSGKLNVVLNSDTNGNQVGAVIINADIDTNGGSFTSASGGNLAYSAPDGTTKGYGKGSIKDDTKADPNGSTVGTYFGHINDTSLAADGLYGNRSIKTEGGAITLNGEVAIGLAGGTLTLDSTGKDAAGKSVSGDIKVTGIINSGNSYTTYIEGTDGWNNFIESTKDKDGNTIIQQYLNAGTVPSYHYKAVNYEYETNDDGTYKKDEKGNYIYKKDENGNYIVTDKAQPTNGPYYTYSENGREVNTEDPRWTANGEEYSRTGGTGWTSLEITGTSVADSMTVKEFLQYYRKAAQANFKAKYGSVNLTQDNATIVAAIKANPTLLATLRSDINDLLAVNWFAAEALAKGNTGGGSAVNDTYLATITTILENSLTAPNGPQAVFVGGRGSGVRNKQGGTAANSTDRYYPYSYYGMPADPTYQDGMYWVTGPEGEANNGKGTQFYSNVKSDWSKEIYGDTVYGYANWATWTAGGVTRTQPDNSSPFLTVGYGSNNQWDDISMAGGYGGASTAWAKGFIQEKNLMHSSLNVQAGTSAVNLQGNIGGSEELDTVNIQTTGDVTLGGAPKEVTKYGQGSIDADHGVYISGQNVKVGGEITTGKDTDLDTMSKITDTNKDFQLDNVIINAAGNLEVHGIDAEGYSGNTTGGKIKLTSAGDTGVIKLGTGMNYVGETTDGTLKAASAEKGAVIIDAQGTKGAFVNETTGKKGIDTAGTWLIYSASPDKDIFGTNLDSKTDAEWTAKSKDKANDTNSSGKTMNDYDMTDSTPTIGKYIFQVQPVITVSGADTTKTYGVEWGTDELKKLISYSASYVNSDNTPIDVATGKDQAENAFTNAFRELDYKNYISNADGTKIGESNISYDSLGKKKTADRENGNKTDANGKPIRATSDNAKAIYNLSVKKVGNDVTGIHGYDVITKDGSIEITKRKVTINQDGTITYGSKDGIKYGTATDVKSTDTTKAEGLTNGDTIGSVTMTTSKEYQNNKGTRNTGDARKYGLTTDGTNTHIVNNGKDVSVNYDISGSGTLIVNQAPLHIYTEDVVTPYGIVRKTQSRSAGLTNGDEGKDAGFSYDYGDYGHGYLNGNTMTNQPGSYPITTKVSGLTDDLIKNYAITIGEATLHITPLKPDQTTHYVEGARRPQDKIESALPVFRVDAEGTVKQYGTYGIENKNQAVTLSPTGMRMPEPNQTSTQDRKYMTSLKTPDGQGTFRLEYDGVVLRVIPVDPAAEQIVEAGDKLKNVALSEQALHVAYTQMGLDLVNLKGVYIYMAPM